MIVPNAVVPCMPVRAWLLLNVKLSLTKPVALTLPKTSVGLSSTLFTKPTASTPTIVVFAVPVNVKLITLDAAFVIVVEPFAPSK